MGRSTAQFNVQRSIPCTLYPIPCNPHLTSPPLLPCHLQNQTPPVEPIGLFTQNLATMTTRRLWSGRSRICHPINKICGWKRLGVDVREKLWRLFGGFRQNLKHWLTCSKNWRRCAGRGARSKITKLRFKGITGKRLCHFWCNWAIRQKPVVVEILEKACLFFTVSTMLEFAKKKFHFLKAVLILSWAFSQNGCLECWHRRVKDRASMFGSVFCGFFLAVATSGMRCLVLAALIPKYSSRTFWERIPVFILVVFSLWWVSRYFLACFLRLLVSDWES